MNTPIQRITSPNRLGLGLVTLTLAIASTAVQAATECFTFDKFGNSKEFIVGDTKQLKHASVTFYPLFDTNLQAMQSNDSKAIVDNYNILGSPPALLLNNKILFRVMANQRISRVTFDYAQNTGASNNLIVNLGVNGEIRSWRGTLADQNGESMGMPDVGGRVKVTATQQPHGDGHWVKGTVTLESDPVFPWIPDRGIDRFAVGGTTQVQIDNVCLEKS